MNVCVCVCVGLLHAGDRIIEVNGFPVDGMEPEQVIQVVVGPDGKRYSSDQSLLIDQFSFSTNQQARSQGTIMFKVVPITERPVHNQTMVSPPLQPPRSVTRLTP